MWGCFSLCKKGRKRLVGEFYVHFLHLRLGPFSFSNSVKPDTVEVTWYAQEKVIRIVRIYLNALYDVERSRRQNRRRISSIEKTLISIVPNNKHNDFLSYEGVFYEQHKAIHIYYTINYHKIQFYLSSTIVTPISPSPNVPILYDFT